MSADDLGEPHDPAAFRSASEWDSTSVPPTGLEVLVPDGWAVHADPQAPAILTMLSPAAEREGDFRPSIVVTVEQPVEQQRDIAEYTRTMVAGLRANLTDAHVIAIDPLWVGGFEGRRVITGYREGMHTLVAQQYWALDDAGIATSMTGTSSVEQYLWAADVFAHAAAGLSVASRLATPAGDPA
ncbi:hypothetical protein CLV30_10987 [Haloactinopolyspora alba]|uniref:Lipoprotein LpqN n=1 Tax=Haloactinopolyspora alba TaxID=648780 RepID=A0A2P8DZZ1_9ACTN|nr:hypothetical protein [Haloactinopolyspora alba]PSL02780.1 hypothetical protein CLV30_10987 [Haloactinopolyspora alba]